MQKLPMHSQDITQDNIERIAALFPHCVKEAQNEQGELVRMVDFDALRQELSNSIVEGPQERYDLNWPGKRAAQLAANAPIAKTLRPCKAESVDFDSTKNVFIEGDNLDALKLLQKSYLGKVKMIYIDPPYNTGNDFIYEDDFAENTQEFLERSNQVDEEGNRLVANTESNGRFHSDWLSMMYPRLKLARNLLRDDGVIFISVNDKEIDNIRKISTEIFGEKNFIAQIANINNPKGRSDDKFVATAHEYILIFARSILQITWHGFELGDEIVRRYNKQDEYFNRYREIDLRKTGDGDLREDRPNLFFYFYYNQNTGEYYPSTEELDIEGFVKIIPLREDGKEGRWRWGIDTVKEKLETLVPKFMPSRKIWGIMEKDYLHNRSLIKPTSSWTFKDANSERGTEEFIALNFDKRFFPNPKPLGTIQRCLQLSTDKDSIILDFFAGSATTAHAVMQLNAEDGGNRQFIMVQLPEACDEKSEAFKAGYANIAEISKERIRRAGTKIQAELKEKQQQEQNAQPSLLDNANTKNQNSTLDIGFRVLKVDSSNMADVYYTPSDTKQDMLASLTGNIKTDRTPEDLLFQVLIDWGVEPTLPIREEIILGKKVFFVDENALVACFETGITNELAKALAKTAPLRVLFRDNGFASDAVKINIEQIFTQLSPHTEVKCL